MNGFDDRPKNWNADLSPSKTSNQGDLGTTMNAISFGFVATAILISMFLIMAIFEYLLRPKPSNTDQEMQRQTTAQLRSPGKLSNLKDMINRDFSVLMPGQNYPTYLAQPAPLPCQREGMHWPYNS
ncbi:Cytochrome c oxidase subunit IV family protein [Dioscorea alata]|uniref:Cytochrome c oxidase subunit IV family protein n=2 Tax=Dioscorea alata TaxID=55571 RepID=A0ACB7VAT7_DIOAL|nr:Cytochrome c oxidase subunit IV family protein [Dioscorea alata]KAH7670723.1 Cytochrome c oxidase subunit IV family protein [Dioscorea alata]